VFHPGTPVGVQTDCGSLERSGKVAEGVTRALAYEGYKDGPNAWMLRVTGEQIDSGERLPQDREDPNSPTLPAVRVTLRLVTPDGKELGPDSYVFSFARKKSKYYARPRRGEVETVERYNFQGKDPKQAVADEIWDLLVNGSVWTRWPRGVVKADGKYLVLPQASKLEPGAADRGAP
jgi:hypothetical protein